MSSFASTIAEAVALQSATTKMLTEICELQTQITAVQPLVQEFRDATTTAVIAARSVPPRPSNMTDNIIRSAATTLYRSPLTIKVPQ